MDTFIGIVVVVVWCGAGILGQAIRVSKGYEGGSVGAIVWGGPIYLLVSLVMPDRR